MPGSRPKSKLAAWDIETIRLTAEGNNSIQAAKALQVSPDTVKSRLKSAYRILNARNAENCVAIACARGHITIEPREEPNPPLGCQLLDVLVLIARGKTHREMAKILNIPFSTVKQRIRHLYQELPAKNACELVYLGFVTGNLIKRKPEGKKWTTKSPPPNSGDGSAPSSASSP